MLEHGDYWLVVGDKLRIAHERALNGDGSITVDLYRNLDDYRADRAMERAFTFWRYVSPIMSSRLLSFRPSALVRK